MNKKDIAKTGSVAVFVLAVLGLIYLISRGDILSANPVGIVIQVGSVGLMIWARITFGFRSFHAAANTTKGRLVTNGPYRWLRHPIYSAVIYFTWAGVMSHLHWDAAAAALLVTLSLFARMLFEERFLRETYEEYESYSKHTARLIPFVF
jgi:protein-S-isoprenylcysteine O-methyltransferase Ste14